MDTSMTPDLEGLFQEGKALLAEGKSIQEIEKVLIAKEQTLENIEAIIKKLNHDIHLQKLRSGKLKIIIGIILLGINFIITCINFHNNEPIALIMYTFTSAGVLMLCWGVYDIFN